MKRTGSFLVGTLIGAGLAMLLTPRLAPEQREQVRERARQLRNRYGQAVSQGRLRATELVRSGVDTLDQKLTQVRNRSAGTPETPAPHPEVGNAAPPVPPGNVEGP